MKSTNRWLTIIGIIIAVLIIGATTLVLTLKNNSALLPDNTPDGVVQRYIIALKNTDYPTAYGYLSASTQTRVVYNQWKPVIYAGPDKPSWQVTLGKPVITGNTATLDVVIDRFNNSVGILNNSIYSQTVTFQLEMETGKWKISQPDYVYFLY